LRGGVPSALQSKRGKLEVGIRHFAKDEKIKKKRWGIRLSIQKTGAIKSFLFFIQVMVKDRKESVFSRLC